MRRLENAIINGSFNITGESTLGASLSSLIANYGTDAAGNALILVPPDIAGNAQRLQSPDDALAGRPASTVIDTTAWDTVLSGVTRLLENINGAARADAFGRLDITAPSEAPAVHPTVLDQDVNLVTAGIRIDPRQARTRTAEVGQPVDVGTITETFLGDGQGGTRDRPFVLSRRVDRTQYSAIRLALQGVGAEAPTTENLRLPGTQTTADWVLDGDLNAVYSTDDTPLTAQTRMFIDYVYAEPSLATLAGSEGGVTKRVDDPHVTNQLTAYHRALLENRLHPAPVIRAELPVTPWADAKDRVELPPPGAYCVLNLSMMGYQQVYALINNVTVTDRQGALHPVISAEVSPVPAALHHQSNRDFWRKLLHPPLSAAQRSLNFGSQPAVRQVPEEVVIRQGLNLPALLGGAATQYHTVGTHGGSGNPDGGRIIHGSIARVDGRRFPAAALRWHCMVRVHGDTTQALLFLWDPDAINPATMGKGVRLGAEYTVNKSTPAGADNGCAGGQGRRDDLCGRVPQPGVALPRDGRGGYGLSGQRGNLVRRAGCGGVMRMLPAVVLGACMIAAASLIGPQPGAQGGTVRSAGRGVHLAVSGVPARNDGRHNWPRREWDGAAALAYRQHLRTLFTTTTTSTARGRTRTRCPATRTE